MDAPVYQDDLTTLDSRHAAPLLRLHQRARAAVAAIEAAASKGRLNAALVDLAGVAMEARIMFAEEGIGGLDMPFGKVSLLGDETPGCGDDVPYDGCMEEDGDSVSGHSTSSDSEDVGGHSQYAMDLNDTGSTAFIHLRRLYTVYYGIHLHRLGRLVLRLPSASPGRRIRPFDSSTRPPNGEATTESHQPLLPPDAGNPLSQETSNEYAEAVADEMELTTEYRNAVSEMRTKEVVGHA